MPTLTLETGQKIKVPSGLSKVEMDAIVADAATKISSMPTNKIKDFILKNILSGQLETAGTMAGSFFGPAGTATGALGGSTLERAGKVVLGQPLGTFTQELQESAEAVKRGAIAEVGGQAISGLLKGSGKLAEKGIGYVGRKIAPVIPPAKQKLYELAEKLGIKALPGEVTARNLYEQMEGLFKKLPITTDIMQKLGEKSRTGLLEAKQNILDLIGKAKAGKATADEVVSAIKSANQKFKIQSGAKYDLVEEMAKGKFGGTQELRDSINTLLAEQTKIPSALQDKAFIKTLNSLEKQLGGKTQSFEKLRAIREVLGKEAYSRELIGDKATGAFKLMKGAVERDIENMVAATGDKEIMTVFKNANKFYKEGKWKFNESFIAKLNKEAEKNPDNLINLIFKEKTPLNIKLTKDTLGKNTFNNLKRSFTQKFLDKGFKQGDYSDPVLAKEAFDSLREGMNKYGKEMLEQIYSKEELQAIKTLADLQVLARSSTEVGKTTGLGLIGSGMLLGGGVLAGKYLDPESATYTMATTLVGLLATRQMTKMLMSDAGRKFLINGVAPAIELGKGKLTNAVVRGITDAYQVYKANEQKGQRLDTMLTR